jgi:hypothetical protein
MKLLIFRLKILVLILHILIHQVAACKHFALHYIFPLLVFDTRALAHFDKLWFGYRVVHLVDPKFSFVQI